MKKKIQEAVLKEIIEKKKIPVIILDPKWHELFPDDEKTSSIQNLEKKLVELLKRQGKLVNDMKDMKKAKAKLMDQIMLNMGGDENSANKRKKEKKQNVSQKLILEINEKIEAGNDELLDIPYRIRSVNEQLVIECLKHWYSVIDTNTEKINQLDDWITNTRLLLKKNILLKQETEELNTLIYTYMHNLLGHDVIDRFDTKFSENGDGNE